MYKYQGSKSHKEHIDSLSATIQNKMDEMENMKKELNNSPWKQRMSTTVTAKHSKTAQEIAGIHADSLRRTFPSVTHHENYVNYQKDIDDCKKALDCLSMGDITEIKSLNSPPAAVKNVVQILSVFFSSEETWAAGVSMMRDAPAFLRALANYDAT